MRRMRSAALRGASSLATGGDETRSQSRLLSLCDTRLRCRGVTPVRGDQYDERFKESLQLMLGPLDGPQAALGVMVLTRRH